ncbi:Bgt-3710 [Blumeria graminis f. sp. tritici]|uniref:Mitochondrial distribution and morphology protein 12 n=2 Tax=Blumeria graminis f. sp. tritici TaxID=62690 RepID=A0A061HS09_BLUGR|nr:Mitochondrial outer membrane protein [Blumeria graminis f. sp. tritici 96224]VDB93281.1 Bgt-3710 [Blumeria graminis f. sp. tritici]
MSVDVNWETLTSGPDGLILAEKIRDFVHEKFQAISLPHFIKSVGVQTFELGTVAPEIEIKDICDPFHDFYEGVEDDETPTSEEDDDREAVLPNRMDPAEALREEKIIDDNLRRKNLQLASGDQRSLAGFRLRQDLGEVKGRLSSTSPAGISGGTSNLNYFHSQLASGISGTRTPLAAVAGAHHLPSRWLGEPPQEASNLKHHELISDSSRSSPLHRSPDLRGKYEMSTSTQAGIVSSQIHRESEQKTLDEELLLSVQPGYCEPRVEDVQTIFRVRYAGDIKLSLTAELLLDYPMPSFFGIPIKLKITGLTFDGIAVLASIRNKAHFCFLSPEDALSTLGTEPTDRSQGKHSRMDSLLQEIKVESEIGKRENGKQVLKNVGKVEKFVLEQVRRIFEDELVYPSFWTFLI